MVASVRAPRWRACRAVVSGVLVTLLTAGCSSTPAPSVGDAEQTLRSAHFGDRQSAAAINGIVNTQGGADAARKVLAGGTSAEVRWFALYVYVNSADDPAPLRPLLTDPDPSVRVVAATGLVRLGEAAAFPVLIESLTHTETLPESAPPTPVWTVATETLARMIGDSSLGPPFDANAYQRDIAHAHWLIWYETHRSGLRFDAGSGEWNVA